MAVRDSKMVRIGAWAALITGAALVVKVAHIFATDGSDSVLHPILYIGGIAIGILGAAGVGAAYGSSRLKKIGLGVGTFFLFMFFIMMLSDAVGAAVDAVVDAPAYVADEFPIALAGLAWLVTGYKLLNKTGRSTQVA
jgi:hypothetical protein